MDSGILTAFYSKREDAQRAFRRLDRKEARRLALLYKSEHGDISIQERFWWYRIFGIIISSTFFLIAIAGPILLALFSDLANLERHILYSFLILVALIGAVVGWFLFSRSRFGIDSSLVRQFSRSLMPGESVLILQAPSDSIPSLVQSIRDQSDPVPTVFVLHPSREKRVASREAWVALSREQIKERALYQAIDHYQLEPQEQRNKELLKRVKRCRKWIQTICRDLAEACRLEQGASPVAEWIIDNEFVIESTVRDVRQNLPVRYYRELPKISGDPYLEGMPFIYGLAKELVADTELRLDRENILSFLQHYQSARSLSTAELWAIPQMLRVALVESIQSIAITAHSDLRDRQLAALWSNRLIAASRRAPEKVPALLTELEQIDISPYFCTQLIDHLYDEESVLVTVELWVEKLLEEPLHQCTLREQNRQSKAQISISNAFISLRQLTQVDWREIFEQVSVVEKILRFDPAGVYAWMDFETRDRYRRVVEDFAQRSGQPEEDIAHSVIELATQALNNGVIDERMEHVGSYLVGNSRSQLARTIHCREPFSCLAKDWLERHHTSLYLISISTLTALLLGLFLWFGVGEASMGKLWLFALCGLIPASQMAVQIVNFLVTHLLPPKVLSKMDFEDAGIPDEFRTLIVVPTLLVNPQMLQQDVEKLEIRYMANRDKNLLFSLFTDFCDSSEQLSDSDKRLLTLAIDSIEELNSRHGGRRFLLFHRQRVWSESEQTFMGKERKRGKLEELNRLLVNQSPAEAKRLIHVGDFSALAQIRFVITLDSDTQLPHGTARRMIETLAHPLNRHRFDNDGRICSGTYTIIQPRVSPSLASTNLSTYSHFFSDAAGIDPYTKAVSDVYQDLSGQGSYHGKGIYDVNAFSRVLENRFPEERILSHDLIEGEYVRVGLASDIELYDEFPQSYQSDTSRMHRWIRGDWQIARWLLPRVPLAGGKSGPNQLGWFSRWKILDNLRRSLVPAASVSFLLAGWLAGIRIGLLATLIIAVQVFFHPLAQLHAIVSSRAGLKSFSPAQMGHNVLRAGVDAALLPHQSIVALDAIFRALYRCIFSKRNLLAWVSAQMSTAGPRVFALYLFLVSPLSLMVGLIVYLQGAANLMIAMPLLLLFLSRLERDENASTALARQEIGL